MRLTDSDQRELERAIDAHIAWLTSEGVELPSEAERLTAIDAFSGLEDAKAKGKLDDPSHGASVLRSLIALCAFRTRAIGIEEVRASIEARWNERMRKAERKSKPQIERQKRAILAVHDDTQLKVIEAARCPFSEERALAAANSGKGRGSCVSA